MFECACFMINISVFLWKFMNDYINYTQILSLVKEYIYLEPNIILDRAIINMYKLLLNDEHMTFWLYSFVNNLLNWSPILHCVYSLEIQ